MPRETPESPKRAASRIDSFRYAFAGIAYVLRTQRNTWIYAVVSVGVVALGAWLGVNRTEWAILLLEVGLVWTAEFVNTAFETLVDLASPEVHPLAKIGKDVSAAAVLLASFTAALVGLVIFGPPLWARLTGGT